MNRYPRRDLSLLKRTADDEEQLYEKQALIDDQELYYDESNTMASSPLGIRYRQVNNKTKANQHEDQDLSSLISPSKTRDLISEPFVEFTHYDIQPNDTLQSICLRYAISVNQVKRINGLMSDQDFYGLKRIKLPLGKFGLLEDILKSKETVNEHQNQIQQRNVNSPGSALSVSKRHNSRFKPLLGPGFSSDRLNELGNSGLVANFNNNDTSTILVNNNSMRISHNHSNSFSSLRELSDNVDLSIDDAFMSPQYNYVDIKKLKEQNFIKSDMNPEEQIKTQDLMTDTETADKVFEDLDYHVERAKAAAENYDKRAADLVDRLGNIRVEPFDVADSRQPSVSKIPEVFFCNESFGLNYKKLLLLIFFICLVVPLVTYYNQSNVVTTPLK